MPASELFLSKKNNITVLYYNLKVPLLYWITIATLYDRNRGSRAHINTTGSHLGIYEVQFLTPPMLTMRIIILVVGITRQ